MKCRILKMRSPECAKRVTNTPLLQYGIRKQGSSALFLASWHYESLWNCPPAISGETLIERAGATKAAKLQNTH